MNIHCSSMYACDHEGLQMGYIDRAMVSCLRFLYFRAIGVL